MCSLWLVDEGENKLRLGANFGVISKQNIPEYNINWDAKEDSQIEGLTPWVLIRKRSFFGKEHQDLKDHPSWKGRWDDEQWKNVNFGCLYAVPLLDVKGKAFGVLKIENGFDDPKFDEVDRATFDLMADFVALALEFNSRLRADIVYDFFHLLKQPATNAIGAFTSLRLEIQGQRRQQRIDSRLDMLAKNLETLRIWILNVYGLATARNEPPDTPEDVVPLRSILSSAADNMHNLFDNFRCDLSEVDNSEIRLTRLKRQKVDAILFNLLDNSYKYSDKPDNKQISALVQREDHNLKLILRDNGRGIPQEELAHVFDPGFTSGNTFERWPGSLGLGLATVARLLNELGWGKKVESVVGEGTKFVITIPEGYIV